MFPHHVWTKVYIAFFSKVCISPFHVGSNFVDFSPHIKGSNADFAPHMEGSHADFAPHLEQRYSFRNQRIAKIASFKRNYLKPPISSEFIWPMWPLFRLKLFWGRGPLTTQNSIWFTGNQMYTISSILLSVLFN